MANTNSILPLFRGTPEEVANAIGVTQFPGPNTWYQIIGGLQIQGGYAEVGDAATLTVFFVAPYATQLLGVFIQVVGATGNAAYVNAADLDSFEIVNGVGDRSYYWFAVGV